MTAIEGEFFQELQEWSCRKLDIIERYLAGFTRILGSSWRKVYYIDGFAGKGMYGNGEKGSPVRAAELANSQQYSGKLYCFYVEKNPENFADLQQHTAQFGGIVRAYNGTFSDKADDILRQVSGMPGLFFLDDFGVQGSDWCTVEKVLSRTGATDVWIRFDHKTVRRLDGFFASHGKGAAQKTALLGEHFGVKDPIKLHKLLDGPTPESRIQNAVNLYQCRLEEVLGVDGFTGSYPVTSINGQNKYHLLFACKSPKAAVLASDVVNKVEETFEREQMDYQECQRLAKSGQLNLFSVAPTEQQILQSKVDDLKPLILGLASKICTVEQLRYCLIQENKKLFGKIRQTHITKALTQLRDDGKITLTGAPSKDDSSVMVKL